MRYRLTYPGLLATLFILSLMMVLLRVYGAAVISTDKPDYSPGDTAIISGSGFLPNVQVTISITRPDSTVNTTCAGTDGSGAFTCNYPLNGIVGTYTVTATDGTNTATTTFTDCLYKITITSSPITGAGFVKVDGTSTTTPHTFTWTVGSTHTLAALSPVSEGTGKQYVWTSWSDGGAQTHKYTVPGHDATVTANYKTQYYINVTSAHDSPTASAWVDAGSCFTASVTSPADIVSGDHRWVCTGFSVDGGAPQAGTTYTFTNVQAAHTMVFSWKEQFWTQVNSAHDAPTSSQWVDKGGSLTASVTSPADESGGTRYRCTGYTLDTSPPVTDGSTSYAFVNVQSAHTVTFNWIAQYKLTVVSGHDSPVPGVGDHWYDTGTHIDASVTSPANVSGGTRYRCTGYSGTGSVSSGSGTSVSFDITAPSTLTWNWKTQYYLTVKTDPSAIATIPGENWYEQSTSVTLTAPAIANYKFMYWDVDGTPQGNLVNPISVQPNAPHTATAHYKAIVAVPPVGGEWVPINKSALLAPWISLASLMTVVTVSFVYVERKKKQQR